MQTMDGVRGVDHQELAIRERLDMTRQRMHEPALKNSCRSLVAKCCDHGNDITHRVKRKPLVECVYFPSMRRLRTVGQMANVDVNLPPGRRNTRAKKSRQRVPAFGVENRSNAHHASAFSTISRTSRDFTCDATFSSAARMPSRSVGVKRRHNSSERARRAATCGLIASS